MTDKPANEYPLSDAVQKERDTLRFWQEQKIFEETVNKEAPQGEFTFYDGPPFATGQPHYGHLLPGTIKDVVPRFKTMQGYRVSRRWGWDCHGLPIENLIEKELELHSKKEIEEYGIDKFNEAARASVLRYEDDWKRVIPETGRWVDMDNPYKSMDPSYTESIWWSFKNLYDKGLIYEDFKSMHLCPRCETTLANFEVNQGYKDIKDLSVVAKFELVDEPGTCVLAWTTTPWTLPGNVALAVGADTDYVTIEKKDEEGGDLVRFIVAQELIEDIFGSEEYKEVATLKGSALVGKKYQPLFDYYASQDDLENQENGWQIYAADFVTTEDGTGIVHIAPAFGEDDLHLAREHDLPFVQHVDKGGHFKSEVTDFAGQLVKAKDDHQSADIEVIKWLAHNGKLFSKEKYEHSYPHCWRCDTPLLNYATSSWFMKVTALKGQLLENNNKVNWVPDHMQEGRFGKWLEGARDWALSRSRYWGAVLPIWKNDQTNEVRVLGSFSDLKEYTKSSGNRYLAIRHGQSVSNTKGVYNSDPSQPFGLTDAGREQIKELAQEIKKQGITPDVLVTSPFPRAKETLEALRTGLGWEDVDVREDVRLGEIQFGEFDGQTVDTADGYFASLAERYLKPFPGGENDRQLQQRTMDLLFELDQEHEGKTIMLFSHAAPIWTMRHVLEPSQDKESLHPHVHVDDIANASITVLPFWKYPHNEWYEFDVHRPYIDQAELVDTDGSKLELLGEVFDVWYESGSMPYASVHYPFENKNLFEDTRFPANFIAEGLDQTRGWFYVLMVLGTALFGKSPFENVVVNGLVLAEDGKKMSKRLRNYPPLEQTLNSYGADVLRLFLMQSPAVRGEDVRFSEKLLRELSSKVFGRLRNTMKMYQMYGGNDGTGDVQSSDVLDRWILARVAQARQVMTNELKTYALDRAAREISDLVDDLSTWYIRRSRDRFKGKGADKQQVMATTREVMRTIAQIMAPFTPFIAEELWQDIRLEDDVISVHLSAWPEEQIVDEGILEDMQKVRELVSEALELRDQAGIKVRQPLQHLGIKTPGFKSSGVPGLLKLIRDELNIAEISIDSDQKERLVLDTKLTPDLIREGNLRELIRQIQSLRKQLKLNPHDQVVLRYHTDDAGQQVVNTYQEEIMQTTGLKEIIFIENEGETYAVNDLEFQLEIQA